MEEGLFKKNAVNLYRTERWTPSATALPRCRRRDPPYYVPEGDSTLSLHAAAQLSRAVVSTSASKHRTDVRATIPVVQ